MITKLLEKISERVAHRSGVQNELALEQRFNSSQFFNRGQSFRALFQAIATQTNLMVASLVSDDAVADWKRAGESPTRAEVANLCVFCSNCLIQFTMGSLDPLSEEHGELKTDLLGLVRVMYGDFGAFPEAGRLTFGRSLESRDPNDLQDLLYLTRFLDQLFGLDQVLYQTQKIQKMQRLLDDHRRAFAYALHIASKTA